MNANMKYPIFRSEKNVKFLTNVLKIKMLNKMDYSIFLQKNKMDYSIYHARTKRIFYVFYIQTQLLERNGVVGINTCDKLHSNTTQT